MTTKCPICGEVVTGITVRDVRGCGYGGRVWKCISLNCSRCNTSLGIQLDPVALKADLIAEMREKTQ